MKNTQAQRDRRAQLAQRYRPNHIIRHDPLHHSGIRLGIQLRREKDRVHAVDGIKRGIEYEPIDFHNRRRHRQCATFLGAP